ncbi:MAG: T9SS type A sorting domain-containing protein [Paludibacter sp.]
MKKITRLLALFIALFCTSVMYAAQVPSYIVNETFTGATAYPTGWADATTLVGSNNAGVNWTTPVADQLSLIASGSGTRGRSISFPTSGAGTTVYIDFDWFITSSMIGNRNALALILHDNVGVNIFSLYVCGSDAKFHYWNIEKDSTSFIGNSFNRASTSTTITDSRNLGSQLNFGYSTGTWYNIKATLDFSTHIITSMKLTNKSDNSFITSDNKPFLNSTASDITKISIMNTRSSNAGNGSNANLNVSIDNFKIYTMIEAPVSNVTVNYFDPSDNPIKTARIAANNTVGETYTALASDKVSFTDGGFYYVYNAASTTSDNVVVLADGSAVINLKFSKVAVTSGTYTWTGVTNGNWNETELNFSTDGSNSLGYQNGNGVIFNGTGANKIITLNNDFDLGSNDVTISSDGYSISGTGKLSGTGAVILNTVTGESATLNIINELTGGVVVNGGTIVIAKDAAATKLTVASGSTLNLSTGSAFSKAIAGAGTFTEIPTSNVSYSSAITGVDAINYSLVSAGSASTSGSFSGMPTLNNSFSGMINVNTAVGAATLFGSTTQFTDNKLNLGDNVALVYPTNPASDGSTAIAIGELSGSALSKVMGPRLRALTYNLGGLNTNSTFEGTFENFPADAWSNLPVLNISKLGNGILTLTGVSTGFVSGAVNVNEGTVIVNGTLGSTAVPTTVAAAGILKGSGTVNGATTVNGTLEGRLNFGSSLTLAGTTNLTVDGFNATQYDSISVAGAVTYGGILNVTINAAAPAYGTYLKLIKASSVLGTFGTVNLPAGYIFDHSSGNLVYGFYTNIDQFGNSKLSIYPTLTHNLINIVGANSSTIELVNLIGQTVKNINSTSDKTIINMNGLSTGTYFVKVRLNDGSVKVQKVLYQK